MATMAVSQDTLAEGLLAEAKRRQWVAFRAGLPDAPQDLRTVADDLAAFLLPHAIAAREIGW